MKLVLKFLLLCSLLFLLSSCKNSMISEGQYDSTQGDYSGIFSVTYKNYKNFSALTQTGIISIQFRDSTYSYSAVANYSSDTTALDSLSDCGKYSQNYKKIVMTDVSCFRMDHFWHNSLYLQGSYDIYKTGNHTLISQENYFAKWNLNLVLQSNN